MLENSYLLEFSAQVSQIVFLTDLTVLRLITTVGNKISENSYLLHFNEQVSQIVYLVDLTVFSAYYNCMIKKFSKLKLPGVQWKCITNRVRSSFDRFTAYYNCRS